ASSRPRPPPTSSGSERAMSRLQSIIETGSFPIALPELAVVPDHMHIFMFSAITWNRHHVHYNKDAAIREGLPDVVVQRALLGNYIARTVTDWARDEAEIRSEEHTSE